MKPVRTRTFAAFVTQIRAHVHKTALRHTSFGSKIVSKPDFQKPYLVISTLTQREGQETRVTKGSSMQQND